MDRPEILAIAHSASGYARVAQLLGSYSDVELVYAGSGRRGIAAALRAAFRRPRVLYLVDIGKSTSIVAPIGRLLGSAVVVDTGDLAYQLARSVGGRGRIELLAIRLGEALAIRSATRIVVRGQGHLQFVPQGKAVMAPDVAPLAQATQDGQRVRGLLGLDDAFVVGLLGTVSEAPRLGVTYGWDLVEALALLPDDVHALILGGDGSGVPSLLARAERLGVSHRCRLVGWIDPLELGDYLGAMDVAINTQSNDDVGRVRTTGKLPIYLAHGCPVIASHVGEAARLLGPVGWTVPYVGTVDRSYPERLAAAICSWRTRSPAERRENRDTALQLSRDYFDPTVVSRRVRGVIEEVL
jgi:glycosyltransferase involved in cell wall biosynthesis